jgi:hypothetical protein
MCPPRQCCCCDLYQGVKIWTIVFIVLSVLGAAGSFLFAAWITGFCEPDTLEEQYKLHLDQDRQNFWCVRRAGSAACTPARLLRAYLRPPRVR